jgi:phosphatidylglycerophosphate synthase
MDDNSSAIKSLGITLGVYWFLQNLYYGSLNIFLFPHLDKSWYFYLTSGFAHLFFFYILGTMKDQMVHAVTKEPMRRMNLSNKLTLFRLSSLTTIAFLFVWSQNGNPQLYVPLLALTIPAFLTDLLDGYFARKNNQVTEIGRLLDSGSDYLVIFILTIIFWTFNKFPTWLFITILLRMAMQVLGVVFSALFQARKNVTTTFLGKASFFGIMAYYGLLITTFIWPKWGEHLVFSIVEYILGTILGVSIIDKFLYFWGPKSPSPVDNQSPMNPQSLNGPENSSKKDQPPSSDQ